jgi:hypothetical protein
MSLPVPTTGDVTVVRVHGAFADASSWNGVIRSVLAQIDGRVRVQQEAQPTP